jgi:hypothetical protein
MSNIKITDDNKIPELVKELQSLRQYKVQIGIKAPSGDIVYALAWVHEYGIDIHVTEKMRGYFLAHGVPLKKETTKITIPERSYFRTGFDKNKAAIEEKMQELIYKVLALEITAEEARDILGEFVTEKIRNNIVDMKLIKEGKLRDAIGYYVKYYNRRYDYSR